MLRFLHLLCCSQLLQITLHPNLINAQNRLFLWAPPLTPFPLPLLLPPSAMLCKHNYFLLRVWRYWRSKRRCGGRGVEGGRGRGGWMSVELVGRSGAAPPVIIRVTAARARLCAACTRRDVLPREKSEHLSVPPRRQQPPTSLSNSTQLVTRSPNSYFLSLTHTHSQLLCTSFFLFCFRPLLQTAPLTHSLSLQDRLWKQQALHAVQIAKMSACDIWNEMSFMSVLCKCVQPYREAFPFQTVETVFFSFSYLWRMLIA